MKRFDLPRFVAAVVVLVAMGATMTTAHADTPSVAGIEAARWRLRVGAEYGQDSSRGSLASADYTPAEDQPMSDLAGHLWFGASGEHTDAPDTSGGTITTGGRAYAEYGTQSLRGGVAFDHTTDDSLRRSSRWTGMLDAAAGGWTANFTLASRQTSFDSVAVSVTQASRLGARLATATTASCNLHDMGYGGSLGYAVNSWTVTVSGAWNDYDSIDCGFGVPVPASLLHLDRSGFEALTGFFLNRAVTRSGGEIGADSRLLQSTAGITLARDWEKVTLQVDYQHSTDEFGGAAQDNYSLTGRLAATATIALDVVIGTTVKDSAGTPYLGLYVSCSL